MATDYSGLSAYHSAFSTGKTTPVTTFSTPTTTFSKRGKPIEDMLLSGAKTDYTQARQDVADLTGGLRGYVQGGPNADETAIIKDLLSKNLVNNRVNELNSYFNASEGNMMRNASNIISKSNMGRLGRQTGSFDRAQAQRIGQDLAYQQNLDRQKQILATMAQARQDQRGAIGLLDQQQAANAGLANTYLQLQTIPSNVLQNYAQNFRASQVANTYTPVGMGDRQAAYYTALTNQQNNQAYLDSLRGLTTNRTNTLGGYYQ